MIFGTLTVVNLTLIDLPGLTKVAVGKLFLFFNISHVSQLLLYLLLSQKKCSFVVEKPKDNEKREVGTSDSCCYPSLKPNCINSTKLCNYSSCLQFPRNQLGDINFKHLCFPWAITARNSTQLALTSKLVVISYKHPLSIPPVHGHFFIYNQNEMSIHASFYSILNDILRNCLG